LSLRPLALLLLPWIDHRAKVLDDRTCPHASQRGLLAATNSSSTSHGYARLTRVISAA
jgi:hypothetical protein